MPGKAIRAPNCSASNGAIKIAIAAFIIYYTAKKAKMI